jgi:hypothetical protein
MGLGIVVELRHERMAVENLLDDAALDALAAAMNQPDFPQASRVRGADVFVNDRGNVWRGEGMKVEALLDRKPHRVFIAHGYSFVGAARAARYLEAGVSKRAVTSVLMPPRTEKSPTTVIRRGRHAATRSSRIWFVTLS